MARVAPSVVSLASCLATFRKVSITCLVEGLTASGESDVEYHDVP